MSETKQMFQIAGKDVEISTGKMAEQAHGSIFLKMGGTVLFAAVTVDSKDTELDYFPLGVEYIEKMYARGAISGSRFRKREGLPSEEAIIKAREVDHSIRSLFPKSFKRPVSVVLTVLAYDGENDPQALTVLGTSLALLQSGIPFSGPCTSVVVGLDQEENIIINPNAENRENFKAEFIISGVDNKILSFEGWGKEISEEKMDEVLDKANEVIVETNKQQIDFISKIEKTLDLNPDDYDNKPASADLINAITEKFYDKIKDSMFKPREERAVKKEQVKQEVIEEFVSEDSDYSEFNISQALDYIQRKAVREGILTRDERVSGRKLNEIRELKAEVDVLPTVHGSALFSRGQTQSLSITTLAPASNELLIDDMEGETSKTFMHHYNMPGYASGEAGRFNYHPGRREIGHGAIGENAIKVLLPSTEEFPYTIRVVSEIMSSNGSTSMAATCAASMSLMTAGVPLKEPVAGIGVGLVTEDSNEDNYKLLLDIEGMEDFYGDMDFKVCGTKNGVTAIQYENKLQGVSISIIKEAFRLAKEGRSQVLEVMNKTISQAKSDLPANAPKIETIQIDQDSIGALIGPGGKNIKDIVEQSKQYAKEQAQIDITDDGSVSIAANSAEQMNYIKNRITKMFEKAVVGEVYEGVVDKVMNFGAFVNVVDSPITGLLHVSEMGDKFVKDANDEFKKGDRVTVKAIKVDNMGKVSFSVKALTNSKS